MVIGRIPKYLLYGELAKGGIQRSPLLRYRYVCKRDLKALDLMCHLGRQLPLTGMFGSILKNISFPKGNVNERKNSLKSAHREKKAKASKYSQLPSSFICNNCGRDCKGRIGLLSHRRKCARRSSFSCSSSRFTPLYTLC